MYLLTLQLFNIRTLQQTKSLKSSIEVIKVIFTDQYLEHSNLLYSFLTLNSHGVMYLALSIVLKKQLCYFISFAI
jgi:hypothetical protein